MSATTSPNEEPGTSWSENTTPVSEDLGDIEAIEDIVRQRTPIAASPRFSSSSGTRRHPIVRRRLAAPAGSESGIPRTINTYEYAPLRPAAQEGEPWALEEQDWLALNTPADKQSSMWTTGGGLGTGEDDNDDNDDEIERGGSIGVTEPDVPEELMGLEADEMDILIEPKVESPDEMQLVSMQEAGTERSCESNNTEPATTSPSQPKRPRGRPRKHPIPTAESLAKVAKGRSKTGCITCRRRKKKCDEAKPRCMNCEKNAVICEGYPERTVWKNGKEKAEEGSMSWMPSQMSAEQKMIASTAQARRISVPTIHLSPVIHGVETPGDRIFFEHYVFRLSDKLTVEGAQNNAFKDMLLPLAVRHLGLMHSILALSSSNIDYKAPYGQALLLKYPDLSEQSLRIREEYHQDEALKEFNLDIVRQNNGEVATTSVLPARLGQMLCLVVQNLSEGRSTGEHRIHLQAYQNLIRDSPANITPFMEFIKEYFQFHISLDEVVCLPQALPQGPARLGPVVDDWEIPPMVQPEAARLLGVQDGLFFCMSKITSLRNTIRENIRRGIEPVVDYTSLYRAAEIDARIQEWESSWPAGDFRDYAGQLYKQMIWVYLWRTIYPPQAHRSTSWEQDQKITKAVDDGLDLLSKFPSNDSSQTLLLAPTFLLGCAAFDERQRASIRAYIATIKAYTSLRNADRAAEVLEEVWRRMDVHDDLSWDWQAIAHGMGKDFLAT